MEGMRNAIGRCPVCGEDIVMGKYGAYCTGRCGISIAKAFGKELDEEQVGRLLNGDRILVKGLVSKKRGTYNAYLTSEGVESYSYTKKDGTEMTGYRLKFNMEFPEKEDKEDLENEEY